MSNLTHKGASKPKQHTNLATITGIADQPPFTLETFFDSETVVTLDVAGLPLSRYSDNIWNVSAMGNDGGETEFNLYFFDNRTISTPQNDAQPGLAFQIREEQKALLWLHIDAGRQRALKTIYQASLALNNLARGAYRRGITLFDLFCDPTALAEETADMNTSYARSSQALLKTVWRNRGFLKIAADLRLKEQLNNIKKTAKKERPEGQTPIIPSNIYCAILANLISGLDKIEAELPRLLDAYGEESALRLRLPEHTSIRKENRNNRLETLYVAIRKRGWEFGNLQWYVSGPLSRIQTRLMNVVIAFTGMRIGEARLLPLDDVLDVVDEGGSLHYVVRGFSCKLNGGKKMPASWVTNEAGSRAIKLAQRIASTILGKFRGDASNKGKAALLFPSSINPYKIQNAASIYARMQELIPELCPSVTQRDIDELNAMELERDWMRSSIVAGRPWPLTFHQYRRSLSVYAHRSGMVSLPALKGQLQHITDEMRAYYSDGFCRAVNLVFDKNHFSHEWRSAKAESSFLAYTLALLFSDNELIGEIGGQGAERMRSVVSTRTRSETLKLFRDGKLAYRETVLGGCTAIDGCDQSPLEPIPWECIEKNCTNSVVFSNRLKQLMLTQEAVVAMLSQREPGSVEHRLEAAHLAVLVEARLRMETSP